MATMSEFFNATRLRAAITAAETKPVVSPTVSKLLTIRTPMVAAAIKTVSEASTTITPETTRRKSSAIEFNKSVAASIKTPNRTPNPPASIAPAMNRWTAVAHEVTAVVQRKNMPATGKYASLNVVNNVANKLAPLRSTVSPYKPTKLVKPENSMSIFKHLEKSVSNLHSRRGVAGVPPPKVSERTTHFGITEMKKLLDAIPANLRSVSGRDVAMTPRIDQSAPMGVASPLGLVNAKEMAKGTQQDNTTTTASPVTLTHLAVGGTLAWILLL